jgi:hypothetical protein
METLALLVFLPALVVGLFALLFGLGQVVTWEALRRSRRRLWPLRFNLWQMMTGVAVAALALVAFESVSGVVLAITLGSLLVLAWFIRNWCHEFVFLMGLRDEDFPGRNDKLTWAVALLALAPISIWFFRSYRLAHWPVPKSAPASYAEFGPQPQPGTVSQPA